MCVGSTGELFFQTNGDRVKRNPHDIECWTHVFAAGTWLTCIEEK